MSIRKFLAVGLLSAPFMISAQKLWNADLGAGANFTSNKQVPFWLRSNKFGSVPDKGASASAYGSFHVLFDSTEKKLVDWGMGAEARLNVGNDTRVIFIEAYAKARLSIFQFKAGRSKDAIGFTGDTLLTSGSFSMSGNSLGIPKLELSIPEFYRIPIFGGLLSFKGNFVHGWLGQTPIQYNIGGSTASETKTYFHQKSFYGRIGKPSWRLSLYGGFNHNVFWGNEKDAFGTHITLSPLKTFEYVVLGKVDQQSKVGNHLGSIDVGLQYDFDNVQVTIYRQSLYDVGALYYLANIADGLNGISLRNKSEPTTHFRWNRLLFEVFYTKNQAGYPWSKITPSGDEDYYNNYIYTEGWSYQKENIGNPFVTSRQYARTNLPTFSKDYFVNNRLILLHAGVEGSLGTIGFLAKVSYSKNYGTFGTSIYGRSTGTIRGLPAPVPFPTVSQLSTYLQLSKSLPKQYFIRGEFALDTGKLLYNSSGIALTMMKQF